VDLRDLIRAEISRRGISQAAFGRRVGASAGLISRWLSEELPTQPGYEYCLRIAAELRMPAEDVLELAGHRVIRPSINGHPERVDHEKEMVMREIGAILDRTPRTLWTVLTRVTRATSEALPESRDVQRNPEQHHGNDDGRDNVNESALNGDTVALMNANYHPFAGPETFLQRQAVPA
jgi:transcriptional regulator with XRE-family HTH domain